MEGKPRGGTLKAASRDAGPGNHCTFRVEAGEGGVAGENLCAAREQQLLQAVTRLAVDEGTLRKSSSNSPLK